MDFIKRHWRVLFILAITLMLVSCILIYRPRILPAGYFNTPAPQPPDVIDFEELATKAPEELEIIPGAVTILINGEPMLTLESAAMAQALLEWRLEQIEVRDGETLLSAELFRDVALRHAIEGEIPVSEDTARTEFMAACPVRIVTRRTERESIPYETEQTEDERLVKGARMVLISGRDGEDITVSEYAYIDGIREAVPVRETKLTRPPVNERVAIGTYTQSKSAPGENEGEKGPDAPDGFSLKAPCSSKVISNFGTTDGIMHNGLGYSVKVGDKVTAPEKGTVVFARERAGFGFLMEIDHGGGFVTRIAPIDQTGLRLGDKVEKGQELGIVAAPVDEDDEPFLYMELLINGIPYNPRQY